MESLRKPGGLEKFQVTDREECGVVIQNEEGLMFVLRVPNRSENPEDYIILKSDVQNVAEVLIPGEKIIGFFHTHLKSHECEPTDTDFEGAAQYPEMQNLIYQPSTGKFCWYSGEIDEVVNGDKT